MNIDSMSPHNGRHYNESGNITNIADSYASKTIGYGQLAVAQVALALTPTIYKEAVKAIIIVEDAAIRYRTDGIAPTSTLGMPSPSGSVITLESRDEVVNFKAICPAGTAKLNVEYKW